MVSNAGKEQGDDQDGDSQVDDNMGVVDSRDEVMLKAQGIQISHKVEKGMSSGSTVSNCELIVEGGLDGEGPETW